MIKINLLPTKRKPARKVTELQKQIAVAVLVLGGVTAGMVFYYLSLNAKIEQRQRQKKDAEDTVRKQELMLKEVKDVEDERKKVMEKIGVIEQLKKNQLGPVHLLDEISRALPPNVDLTSLTESSGNINLTGDAFNNDDIVKFVENLKASPFFTDVYLLESSQASSEGYDIYHYKLQFKYKGV